MEKMRDRLRAISILGTASDVGKSYVATAICRILANQNVKVAPFKSQNISNNSAITPMGTEISRAQFIQAEAARATPIVEMNPTILKPQGMQNAQVILRGKIFANSDTQTPSSLIDILENEAYSSIDYLREKFDVIVHEGAGSCAEINLRETDFTNFKMSEYLNSSVILVADIDKGGVFAQILGTLDLLTAKERSLVKGIIINRFRGDIKFFESGIKMIEERAKIPVLGVIPYSQHIKIDAEDSLGPDIKIDPPILTTSRLKIAVLYTPYISNFTDVHPLQAEVEVHFLRETRDLLQYDALILLGSKNTRKDLEWMEATGWRDKILDFHKSKKTIFGICGGLQMLGEEVVDDYAVEGEVGQTKGLGILHLKTKLNREKITRQVSGRIVDHQKVIRGYEIHCGETSFKENDIPLLELKEKDNCFYDGIRAGNVLGTYVHGIFDSRDFREFFYGIIGGDMPDLCAENAWDFRDAQYELLAKHFLDHTHASNLW